VRLRRSHPSTRSVGISRERLARAPHLAVLDVVDHALRVAACAVYAELPALLGDPHPWRPEPPEHVAARRLLRQIGTFARTLDRYRRTLAPLLEPPPPPDDDIDFSSASGSSRPLCDPDCPPPPPRRLTPAREPCRCAAP